MLVPSLERSCSPGEIAVFEATGGTEEIDEEHESKNGPVIKRVSAHVYRRTRTRLHRTLA
jgi:hypothetical protein